MRIASSPQLQLLLLPIIIATSTTTPEGTDDKHAAAITGTNDLGFKLLRELFKNTNLVISPHTIGKVLSLLSDGAEGETLKQLLSAMGLEDKKELTELYQTLNERIVDGDPARVEIFMETDLYAEAGQLPKFLMPIDFANPEVAADTINDLIKLDSESLGFEPIKPELLDPNAKGLMVTVWNFHHNWKYRFDKDLTAKAKFHPTPNSKPVMEDFMNFGRKNSIKIGRSKILKADVLQLPYAGGNTIMSIFLPDPGESAFKVTLNGLSDSKFKRAIKELHEEDCFVHLPKFSITSKFTKDIIEVMKNLGIKDLFGPEADLSSFHEDYYINNLIHSTSIQLREDGINGTSESKAGVMSDSAALDLPKTCLQNLNRPFIFVLHTKDLIDSLGAYVNPNQPRSR